MLSAAVHLPLPPPKGKGSARMHLGRHFHHHAGMIYYYCAESKDVVRSAVHLMLKDDGFKIPSISTKAAVRTAKKLLEWCSQEETSQECEHFVTDLLQERDSCFKSCCRCLEHKRKLMWKRFFQIRSSAEL